MKKSLNERVFELLEKTNLNWTVDKKELVSVDGLKTDSFGIFRHDTNLHLGTVGERYEPYQNYELAETIVQAADGLEVNFNNGGFLKDGSKTFLQAELPSKTIGNSEVKRYITSLNSHDGSTSIGFGSSNTVVICQNTFYMAYKEINKFRHTITAQERVKAAMLDLRQAIGLDNKLMEKFQIMSSLPLKDTILSGVMKSCFKADLDTPTKDISTRKANQLTQVSKAIETEIKLEGNTLWGLFNGITRYTNHIASKPSNQLEYLMSGTGYDTNLVAFDTIMDWIEKNSNISVPV